MILQVADFKIDITGASKHIIEHCQGYLFEDDATTDFQIRLSEPDLQTEISMLKRSCTYGELENVCFLRKVSEVLPERDALLLHSALFEVDGVGIAFAAHSGTGKTTHLRLWQELLGDKLCIVNGDKPIVRFFAEEPDVPYAYGNPWRGKEGYGCNKRTPLKHICFIERAQENSIVPMKKEDVVDRLFDQAYMPHHPMGVMKTMELIDRLLSSCQLWQINCNMDLSAAQTAYEGIFGSVKE